MNRRIVFLLSLLAAASTDGRDARAQAVATVNISVDATAPGAPIERVWAFHGYDEVNYTTTPAGQSLLKTLGAIQTAPPHIRTHFLLNTGNGIASLKWGSTNAYSADAVGNPIYDWTLMDGVMDTITGAGALPLAEIGFMPHDLSVHPDPYQNSGVYTLDGGCFYPPKDYAKWASLIQSWAMHSSVRYPAVESSWQWELWNEPDIGYWHGTFAEYAKLFDYTEAGLRQALPNGSLGGPAVTAGGTSFLTQFLQHCATGTNAVSGKTGTRLDMISFHAKGGVTVTGGHVEMNLGHQLDLHRTNFNIIAGFPQFKQTPIVVSEADPDGCAACPASQTPADAYRNSPAYGAYEVATMKRTLELEARIGVKVRGLVTWAFMFNNEPYFAGFRALSTNGIHLPVLNAFKLLGSLDGARLPVTSSGALTLDAILASSVRQQPDIDAMATEHGQDIQVLVWNYHDDLVTAPPSPVHLSVLVPVAFGPRATVTHSRVDETHGDAYTVWVSQGSPTAPSAAQITQLQQAMEPALLQPTQTVNVVSGAVSLDFDLPRFGVSLVTLTPVGASDASIGGSGGDSGPATSGDGAAGNGADVASSGDATSRGDATVSTDDASPPGAGGVDATLSPGATGTEGGPSSSGAGSPDGGTVAAANLGRPSNSGCSCGVAGRPSSRIVECAGTVLGVGLPVMTALGRRRRRPACAEGRPGPSA